MRGRPWCARCAPTPGPTARHADDLEFLFWFVLAGGCRLDMGAERQRLTAGDACVLPGGLHYGLADCADLELLEVSLPAEPGG